jgi:hypothetical protein
MTTISIRSRTCQSGSRDKDPEIGDVAGKCAGRHGWLVEKSKDKK